MEGKENMKKLQVKSSACAGVRSALRDIENLIQKPVQTTKNEKIRSRDGERRFSLEEAFQNCLYDEIYFAENYDYIFEKQKKFICRKSLLRQFVDEKRRRRSINFLISLQQALNLGENTFFMAVRIFDYILIKTALEKKDPEDYSLIGVVCMWISNKFVDVHFIKASTLCLFGAFSKEQIISTEYRILKALKFEVNVPEPSSFLFYYLKRECLHNNPEVIYSAMLLLECFTFFIDFSALPTSMLASFALFSVLDKSKGSDFLEHIEIQDKKTFIRMAGKLKNYVLILLQYESLCSEVLAKYSTEEKYFVARNFKN